MTPLHVMRAARILVDARAAQELVEDLPAECRPADAEEGYLIQAVATALQNRQVIGWKAAWTSKDMQATRKLEEPAYGRMFAPALYRSPAVVAGWRSGRLVAEAEFAFRMAASLPARLQPYSRHDVLDAVGTLHPAIEVAGSRYARPREVSAWSAIADNSSHAFFVEGAPVEDWRQIDLPGQRVTLHADGELLAEGSGAMVLGDPLTVLVWMVNKLAGHGIGVVAGDVMTTGTCLGAPLIPRGARLVADFGAVGRAELRVVS